MQYKPYLKINNAKTQKIFCFLIIFLSVYLFNIKVEGAPGIAISGSFNNHHYKIVPGETVVDPGINVVVFNNYDSALKMEFLIDSPDGITCDLKDKTASIPAKGKLSFPVSLTVDSNVTPGDYEVGVSAKAIPDEKIGIQVAGAAEIRQRWISTNAAAERTQTASKTKSLGPAPSWKRAS